MLCIGYLKTIPVRESINFDFEIFKNNTNIQLLVELVEKTDTTYPKLKTLIAFRIMKKANNSIMKKRLTTVNIMTKKMASFSPKNYPCF